MNKQLLVLGCSQTKRETAGELPAIGRYDGPPYRVLRTYLREHAWPENLSVAVLSAEHGLFGGFKPIADYDRRMNAADAQRHRHTSRDLLARWSQDHDQIHFSLGKDYLPAVQDSIDFDLGSKASVFEGPIGMKLHQIKGLLQSTNASKRVVPNLLPGSPKPTYFLPDWDDLLDPKFDFVKDTFSGASRQERGDRHCAVLMQPKRMCDGILVSLAQHIVSKGPLKRILSNEDGLAPPQLRNQFGLSSDQWLFGDCGAFSYVNEDDPAIGVQQAATLYDLHGFDFGASVDHIPVPRIVQNGVTSELSDAERKRRVKKTRENARDFMQIVHSQRLSFTPVGTIQALSPKGYASAVRLYCMEYGYKHIAIGGLVPLSDGMILEIVQEVMRTAKSLGSRRPWVHLFGVFRPKLQRAFRELGVDSFDSATYFRKAWLRSDQNYLSADGKWYAALRVPMTSDGRTRKKLLAANADIESLEVEEATVLGLLNQFGTGAVTVSEVLDALVTYDEHLSRESVSKSIREAYRKTLEARPWELCDCPFCKDVGIHVLIFRGANRNKRRGAHNTLMLYGSLDGAAC